MIRSWCCNAAAACTFREHAGAKAIRGRSPQCSLLTIIMVMSETLPLADVKARLSELVERVVSEHERVLITRRGRPAAVIISPDDLEALEETLDLLTQPGVLDDIRAAEADIDAGRGLSESETRARFLKN